MAQEQGVNADLANQQGVAQPATGTGDTGQVATGQGAVVQLAPEPQTVPYDRFKEVNERMKTAEETAQNLQNQFMIMQANQQRPAQQAQQPSILAELGISEDEPYIPTQHIPRIMQAIDERIANTVNQAVTNIQGQQALQEMPDYGEVVGTNQFGNFVPSPHLWRALSRPENQHIRELISTSRPSPALARLAYKTVVNDPDFKQSKQFATMTPQQRINAEIATKVQAANQQVLSASAAGGGQIGKIDSVSGMSDDQIRSHRSQASSKT